LVVIITIIALLTVIDDTITATGTTAIGSTRVTGIVTIGLTIVTLLKAWAHNTIAATRQTTTIQTAIAIRGIAVIAFFITLDHTVTALWFTTINRTVIIIERIAVVALLTRINHTIAAAMICRLRPLNNRCRQRSIGSTPA